MSQTNSEKPEPRVDDQAKPPEREAPTPPPPPRGWFPGCWGNCDTVWDRPFRRSFYVERDV